MELRCVCQSLWNSYGYGYGGPRNPPTLLKDISRMQNDEAFLDMVFVCGTEEEEEEIRACRILVAARSPVLQSMLLTSGMVELHLTRVPLPHIHPTAMRVCLEFFHTDSVQQSSWPNIFIALQVLKAAMFFLIEPLQILALAYISSFSLLDKKDAEWWTSHVTSYNLGIELIPSHSQNDEMPLHGGCCMGTFLKDFRTKAREHLVGLSHVKLFSGSDYERRFYKELTEPALFHFKQGVHEHECRNGFSQYFSFLHVVRWSSYRVVVKDPAIDEGKFEEVLNKCFPQSTQEMRSMLTSAIASPLNDTDISRYMKHLADPLAECLKRAPIDFDKIHSHMLCRFIEPLDIVPPSILLAAYRCKALHGPGLRWDELAHGTQYKLDEYYCDVISSNSSTLKGFARCSTSVYPAVDSFFDWEIKLWSPCSVLRIGFCVCKPTFKVSECSSNVLGDRENSWALDADGFLHSCGNKSSTRYVDPFVKTDAVVRVHLDLVNKSCSFSIDNKDAGVAWSNFLLHDSHAIYPAISLVAPGKAEVRKTNHSWMDHPSKRTCPSTAHDTLEGTSGSDSDSSDTSS
ncbi:hypothetical protein GOP47_0017207 [Adiantum capillus-veneris]|uniref:BTB domain-containing protein n=1 Tax=Adiantum capillus-veneris TaxID=13818 RepID=A0A9D4UJV7_ADICA|nr:hypothetical protein GOP47_0017207 [Adiantum capillus-veneris]